MLVSGRVIFTSGIFRVHGGVSYVFPIGSVVSDFTLQVGKGVVLLVAAPVALTVFFIPYGLYAGRGVFFFRFLWWDELIASSQVVDGLM